MELTRHVRSMILVGGVILMAGSTVVVAQAAAKSAPGTLSAAPDRLGVMASGAVEDSLKSCLARIPQDASAGQRMIAEQGCERDEQDRQAFKAAPGQ